MRPMIAAALGIVAVLIATSLFVPGLGQSEPLTPSQGATPAVPNLTVVPTDASGIPVATFDTGLASGRVYFAVDDLTMDKTVVVQINDKNASRDGLSNPVQTWTANIPTGGQNESHVYGISYLIPVTLAYGGQWNITASGSLGGFAFSNFTVRTFEALTTLSPSASLPDQNASALILVLSTANAALYPDVTGVTVFGSYTNSTGATVTLPGTPAKLGAVDSTYFNFTLPNNAAGYYSLTIYANTSSAGFNSSYRTGQSGWVGHLTAPTVTLGSCPTGCPSADYAAGTPVYVSVNEQVSAGGGIGASGVTVSFKYAMGASSVTPPGNPPSSVLTDRQGDASISFLASGSVFSSTQLNMVSVTITDPNDLALSPETTNATFTIYNATSTPDVLVTWSSSEYYSGATGTVHWTLGGQNATVLTGWTGAWWYAEGSTFTLAGKVPAGTTSGTISVSIPLGYVGVVEAEVIATNATGTIFGVQDTDVLAGTVLLTPSESDYLPGDTIHVAVTTDGSALTGATLWGTVVDGNGNWISNAAVSGGSISISVPTSAPPPSYKITVVAETPSAGTIASASVTVYQASGVDLSLGITTSSNYLDGSYQPGQTVTVSYTFTARGAATLPQTYSIVLTPTTASQTGYTTTTVVVTSASGTFLYTIPSNAPNGILSVSAYATLGSPSSCVTYCNAQGQFTANVNGNPAALSYQFGNSGFTLGALVAIIVLLVLALIVFVMVRRRGEMGSRPMVMRPESSTSSGSATMSAGTGGSSSSPGADSGSSSGGSPPSSSS